MSLFKLFKRDDADNAEQLWFARTNEDGVSLVQGEAEGCHALGDVPLLKAWLNQLEEEALATRVEGGYLLAWDAVYSMQVHPEHQAPLKLLNLPPQAEYSPVLASKGSLEDESFSISVTGWRGENGVTQDGQLEGPVLSVGQSVQLLGAGAWALIQAVRDFSRRPSELRTGHHNRMAWGRIRRLAQDAGARLDAFLTKTVVVTPEKLAIGLRRARIGDDSVIEVQPTFDGAPVGWIERFDQQSSVQARYDIPTADGIVQVVVTPKVRTVLEEIKRLPGRRVAGARAEAFILNPYAALGQDANAVIDEAQFERARAAAGLNYERFLPRFERDQLGYPVRVGLLVETASAEGPTSSEVFWFDDHALAKFVKALRVAIEQGHPLLAWNGFDLELQGDASEHLAALEKAQEERRRPQVLISYAQVYDLTHYASRVQEIGFEKPYYSPYIAKKQEEEGWFPENIINIISWMPEGATELVSMPISPEGLDDLMQKVATAKAAGKPEVHIPGVPKPMPLAEAERIAATFAEALDDAGGGNFDPEKPKGAKALSPAKRKTPVLLSNIDSVDYAEERVAALSAKGRMAELPAALRSEFPLLPHQLEGVAWLQTLFDASSRYNCRGAVLADDMGLGKTLQLLTLMAWAIEKNPAIEPMLVVAPVSLLENWKEEAQKFFRSGCLSILTAYGEDLSALRVPTQSIDARLRDEDGLTKFLKPNWIGEARVVLTTYETLRDLEFSFASQRWSLMVCDEAQKIKNPAAMVTRAAKKQNVAFRIACTGTPVENTLADLWCLFDFVQAGLLGALNDFGRRYRKPIEAKTDEDKARVEELRKLIAPQILRRTKAEVARDLPKKIVVERCRKLPLSLRQRELYSRAIELFKRRNDPGANVPFKNHLGLLHYLRLICTDPRRHGLDVFKPEPIHEYRARAPKLDWLIRELEQIQRAGEKVIVFCEFRNIQRLLQHYIEEHFDLRPDIINGDTAASASHAQSRQKRIRAFQEKPGFNVIVLSPVAVGFGVNIQAANHVVHYTRTWNPAKEDQATDRAYRIGQTKDVFVYYPVVQADDFTTFDVKLDRLLEKKRGLANDMLNGAGDLKPGDFDFEDAAPPDMRFSEEWVTKESVLSMNWEYFEGLIAALYAKRGYVTHRTPGSGDHGVDVVALPQGQDRGKLLQAKCSSLDGTGLSWDAVKDVVTGHAFYAKRFSGVEFDLACATNQFFDKQTRLHAQLNSVELLEQPDILKMLEATPITVLDIEKVLFTEWQEA